jgi:hypothetical protein
MRFNKPCITCGELTPNQYCPPHQAAINQARENNPARLAKKRELYGNGYARRAKAIRVGATTCHLCGQGAKLNDPFEADHLIPGDPTSPLAPAHRSCNQSRGNKPLPG